MRREGRRLRERGRTNQDAGGQAQESMDVGLFERSAWFAFPGYAIRRPHFEMRFLAGIHRRPF